MFFGKVFVSIYPYWIAKMTKDRDHSGLLSIKTTIMKNH